VPSPKELLWVGRCPWWEVRGHGCGVTTWWVCLQVRVPEDVAPGTTVVRVRARDRDLGLNGAVEYAFSPLTEAQHGAVFGIKSDTGKIYVKAVGLDHEESPVSGHFTTVEPEALDQTKAKLI